MSIPREKVVVLQKQNRDRVPSEERDFWVSMRQSLLMQLATIEKKLGKSCGHTQ
jgi:hypothetical protein